MNIETEYFLEEPLIDQELKEIIEKREYEKVQKRLRIINYLFQYLVPTLFVIIILIR